LPGQIIKPHVASGLPDLAFLRGSHSVILSEAKNHGSQKNNQRCFGSLSMTVSIKMLRLQ
jgi:hypothetical protein